MPPDKLLGSSIQKHGPKEGLCLHEHLVYNTRGNVTTTGLYNLFCFKKKKKSLHCLASDCYKVGDEHWAQRTYLRKIASNTAPSVASWHWTHSDGSVNPLSSTLEAQHPGLKCQELQMTHYVWVASVSGWPSNTAHLGADWEEVWGTGTGCGCWNPGERQSHSHVWDKTKTLLML